MGSFEDRHFSGCVARSARPDERRVADEELDEISPTPLEVETWKHTGGPENQPNPPSVLGPVTAGDEVEPIPPIKTKTVKKRVGGGFVWVTIPEA